MSAETTAAASAMTAGGALPTVSSEPAYSEPDAARRAPAREAPPAIGEELRLTEERFRLLVQGVKDYAIIMLDPAGHVTSWNEGAQRIKGWTEAEILGRSFESFYPPDVVSTGFPKHELEVAAREGRFEDENWRVRKDGTRFWANVVVSAMRGKQGELIGFAKLTRDLTARREAETQARQLAAEQAARAALARRAEELATLNERLNRQTAELKAALDAATEAREAADRAAASAIEAYRELDQFAYVASHDLKAPLRGIANLAQWIEEDSEGRLAPDSIEHMRLLQGRVHRLEALIDGILAFSRAGRVRREIETVDTGTLVREAVDLLSPPRHIAIEIAPGMPIVQAERLPLQQVFMNLIGNAIKHGTTADSDATIRVSWRDEGDEIEFAVSDEGPGIAPEYHERIWGIFQTLASRDKVEGTGVGLSLVKRIVETRGGCASVESAEGRGATFRFTWPRQPRDGGTS